MMSEINVTLQVPAWIQKGLANGSLKRVGGVIQDKQGKIRAWLREGGQISLEQPSEVLTQQIPQLGMSGGIMMGLQVANLAVSAAGFALIYRKLQKVEQQLSSVSGQLVKVDKDIAWLDHKEMVKQVARIATALQILQETELYNDPDSASHLIVAALKDLHECQLYFFQILIQMLEQKAEFTRAEELKACYRAWVMSSTGRIQVLQAKNEIALAVKVAREFKDNHGVVGKKLLAAKADPLLQFSSAKPMLHSMVQEAREAHKLVKGNTLQLEYFLSAGLPPALLEQDSFKTHEGLIVYAVK